MSPGGLLLCFLLRFSATLPRIPNYWVRYKIWMAMTYQESIWLPCLPGISSVLEHCWNVRRGKIWKYWLMHFTAESNSEMCESSCVHVPFHCELVPHTEVTWVCFFSATPPSTPCSRSSPWCWTKMWSQRSPCCTQNCTKIFWRYLINVYTLLQCSQVWITETCCMKSDEYEVLFYFSLPTGSPAVFQDLSNMGPYKYLSR